MTDKKEDTLSGKDGGQQKPNATQPENTPSKSTQGGDSQPPKKGNSEPSVDNTILQELKKLNGRLTKLEQTKKGRVANISVTRPEFSFEYPVEEEEDDNLAKIQLAQEMELLKFEKGVTKLLRNKKYVDLLEKDKTLSQIIENNPLAIISEPVDAEDAISKLQDFLEERLTEITNTGEKENEETKEEEGNNAESIPINPQTTEPQKENKFEIQAGAVDRVAGNLADEINKNPFFLKFHR